MATSRPYPPPVNLKERIAALHQRNISPSQQQTSHLTAKNLPSNGPGALRDKIAKFEEKGGVPVPRGSFGMGAPQLPENAPAKRRGELYGNRVPGLGRPIGTPPSRSGSPHHPADSPSTRKRCVSTGGALLKGTPPRFGADEPAPPLPPTPTLPFARRNSIAVDFGPAERVITSDEMPCSGGEACESPPPSSFHLPSLGVGEASGIIPPSRSSLGPVAASNDAPSPRIDIPSQSEQESAVTELASQADSNLAPAVALEMMISSHSLPGVIPNVEATSAVESDQEISPASDKQCQISQHSAPLVDTYVFDAQLSEAAHPGSSSTMPSSFVSPNTTTELDSELIHPFAPTINASESPAANTKESDNTTQFSPLSESPTTEDRGTISISVFHPTIQVQPSPPSPDLDAETSKAEGKRSFTAVVHRKVTEMPAATAPTFTLSAPMTPQIARMRRAGITIPAEPSPSPGYGELAILLEDAALLEMKLTGGDIFTQSGLVEAGLPNTPTTDTFSTDIRSVSSTTITEHVKAPSTESACLSERSVSIPSILEPSINGDIPEEDEGDGRSLASTTASRSPSHRKYLSSFKRLTGRRSSNYMPGAYPRDSISMSSEDSVPVATPSDHGDGSGEGFGISWPSVSPTKGGSMGKSSFADKLFNRNRTKSNVSTAETDQSSIYNSPKRPFTLSQPPTPTKNAHFRQSPELPSSRSSWTVSRESSSSPASSILDKEIFDAFPSVPQTLPPGPVHLSPDFVEAGVRRLSVLPIKSRKHQQQRMSIV